MGIDFPLTFYKGNESYLYVCWLFPLVELTLSARLHPVGVFSREERSTVRSFPQDFKTFSFFFFFFSFINMPKGWLNIP